MCGGLGEKTMPRSQGERLWGALERVRNSRGCEDTRCLSCAQREKEEREWWWEGVRCGVVWVRERGGKGGGAAAAVA